MSTTDSPKAGVGGIKPIIFKACTLYLEEPEAVARKSRK